MFSLTRDTCVNVTDLILMPITTDGARRSGIKP